MPTQLGIEEIVPTELIVEEIVPFIKMKKTSPAINEWKKKNIVLLIF